MIKRGMRLDELLKVDNPNLSMDLYFNNFFNLENHKNFSNNIGEAENNDIPDYKIYLFKNDCINIKSLGKDFADYYNFNLDEYNKILSKTIFYFYIIVKTFNYKTERIIVPNELFLSKEEIKNRVYAILKTDTFLKIKRYYEHH